MKRIAKTFLKGLFIAIFFTGGSIILSTKGIKTVNEANAATYNQVNEYLISNGYTVLTLELKDGTRYDWLAHTVKDGKDYMTTIFCTSSSIIGHSDVSL